MAGATCNYDWEVSSINFGGTGGDVGTGKKVAQKFQFSGAGNYSLVRAKLKLVKINDPTDDMVIDFQTNSGSSPSGTSQGTVNIPADDVPREHSWLDLKVNSAANFVQSTDFWIVYGRAGSLDNTNYYRCPVQIGATNWVKSVPSYTLGTTKYLNSSDVWTALPAGSDFENGDTQFDLYFSLTKETTVQMSAIVAACGPFFAGTSFDISSGVSSVAARNGDESALAYLEALMKMGTSNGRRILANVDVNRRLTFYEEPASATALPHFLTLMGDILTPAGTTITPESAPVGVWARSKDVLPTAISLRDPLLFIDEIEVDVQSGRYRITPRGQKSAYDIEGS